MGNPTSNVSLQRTFVMFNRLSTQRTVLEASVASQLSRLLQGNQEPAIAVPDKKQIAGKLEQCPTTLSGITIVSILLLTRSVSCNMLLEF